MMISSSQRRRAIAVSLMLGAAGLSAQTSGAPVGIKVDGEFGDWTRRKDFMEDPAGDGRSGTGMDFLKIGAAISADGLALYLKTASPVTIAGSSLRVYLDTDGDIATGSLFLSLGADIIMNFAQQQLDQRFYPMQASYFPSGNALPAGEFLAELLPAGLNNASTHPAADQFEMLIPLSVLPGVKPGGRIGILFRDGIEDFAPDIDKSFFINVPLQLQVEDQNTVSLAKDNPDDIRIASWNVLRDGPLDPSLEGGFGRILAATRPDIINFQEMYDASAAWARAFVNKHVPLQEGQWYAAKNSDCITVSRFPIVRSWSVNANLVTHIDTSPVWGFDAVVVNAHTPAHVENQQPRIDETTSFMLLVRRLLARTEPNAPAEDFALFLVGDLNANSPKIELSIARTGQFTATAYTSLNYWPDNYSLPMADAAPRHTHSRRLYTWRALGSSTPQRLDYLYYQQSRLTKTKSFVLMADSLPSEFLAANNLTAADSRGSDHLLLVTDFRPRRLDYAFDAVDSDSPGWFYSNWMGWLNNLAPGWHYSHLHGFLYSFAGQQGVWFWESDFGWWYTHANYYPFAFSANTGNWVYFFLFPGDTLYYFDYGSGTWKP